MDAPTIIQVAAVDVGLGSAIFPASRSVRFSPQASEIMNMVEMQPATLALSSFPVSDIRPYHSQAGSRQSSKENKTPELSPGPQVQEICQENTNEKSPPVHLPNSPQVAGKKRSANGSIKKAAPVILNLDNMDLGHDRTASNTTDPSMKELSQQLRTRLTYAMVKVQNGWQNRSLDEVESLASQSPRSTTFSHMSEGRPLLSPRAVLSAQLLRQHSSSSSDSDHVHLTPYVQYSMSPPVRKGLAPPVDIISEKIRRRPTPNGESTEPSQRPAVAPRTASQNAVLEADAVETLMFMASPNNSGNASSQFSPATTAPSLVQSVPQRSPARDAVNSATSPKRVAFSSDLRFASRDSMLNSLVERMDEDGNVELERALKTMERHHAMKVAS